MTEDRMLDITKDAEILLGKVFADEDKLPLEITESARRLSAAECLNDAGMALIEKSNDVVFVTEICDKGKEHVEAALGALADAGMPVLGTCADATLRRLAYHVMDVETSERMVDVDKVEGNEDDYYELERAGYIQVFSADCRIYVVN